MHRLPLSDELPYRFRPPRLNPSWVKASRPVRNWMLRREHRLVGIDVIGQEHLAGVLDRGDAVMICPNHCARPDGLVMLDLADRLGKPFQGMAAYQIFEGNHGLRAWALTRMGLFPVDREGSDLAALKAATEILGQARYPLLLFPEGEVYFLSDRLTPLREGVAFLATRAARVLAERDRTVWIVPIGIKYRFPDDFDPMPSFLDKMSQLETRFLWRPATDRPLLERIARYAEAALSLKEVEYYHGTRSGPLAERIASLRDHILEAVERRRGIKPTRGTPAQRIKELRRACLDALSGSGDAAEAATGPRRDLNDLFVAIQTLSYPGDYVFTLPTLERVAETLMKFDEDVLGVEMAPPLGPRRAVVRVGPPLDVRPFTAESRRPREVVAALTAELERRIQAELDAIGPGRPLPPSERPDRTDREPSA